MNKYPYAFICFDEEEELSTIEFANSQKQLADCDLYSEIERAPEYDSYFVLGYVPVEKLLSNGWWWTCGECGRPLYEEDEPVCVGNEAFCLDGCYQAYERETRLRKIRGGQVKAYLISRYPNLTNLSIFSFPDYYASFNLKGSDKRMVWSAKENVFSEV